jgi:hypothetical protein
MSIVSKLLPALALAVALSPAAAHARQHRPVQVNRVSLQVQGAQKSPSVDPVMASSATIDSPSPFYSYAPSGG